MSNVITFVFIFFGGGLVVYWGMLVIMALSSIDENLVQVKEMLERSNH